MSGRPHSRAVSSRVESCRVVLGRVGSRRVLCCAVLCCAAMCCAEWQRDGGKRGQYWPFSNRAGSWRRFVRGS